VFPTHVLTVALTVALTTTPSAPHAQRGPAIGHWPVDPPTIVRAFAPPVVAWAAGHRGVDLAASTGQEVRSMAAGVVTFVGDVAGIPVVTVGYPSADGRRSTYEPVIASVRPGQAVNVGTPLGTVAESGGHCGGARGCLHVGLRTDGRYLNPRILVSGEPAVLKPFP
jgi:murein DD-endopeptidase MepM/ murein hydrolase activator NlpD